MQSAVATRVLLPFAAGVLVSYFFRSLNALLESYLRADVPGVDRGTIGVITGTFFLTIAILQIPLGVLLDRFGPRRVQGALLSLAIAGCVVSASADGVWSLLVGRAMIGLGMAASLMSAFKAVSLWYPPEDLPARNGRVLAAGSVGTLLATLPVEWVLKGMDWRDMFLGLALVVAALAIAILLVVPEKQASSTTPPTSKIGGLSEIWGSRDYWRYMPFVVMGQGMIVAVQTLWVAPWLLDVRGFDEGQKSTHLLLMAAVQLATLLAIGDIVRRLAAFGLNTMHVALGSLSLGLCVLVLMGADPVWVPAWLLLSLLSIFASGSTLLFAAMTQKFPVELSGRLVTSLNMCTFAMVFVAQSAIGAGLTFLVEHAGTDLTSAYFICFAGLVALQALPLLLLIALREERSRA